MRVHKKNYISSLMFCFYLFNFCEIGSTDQQFSLDRLYPENQYVKSREHCMQVWAALDEIIQKRNDSDYTNTIDTIIGKVVFANHCMQGAVKSKPSLFRDDLLYLSRIIGTINERCLQLPSTIAQDKKNCLLQAVAKLKKKVSIMLAGVPEK